MGMSASQARLLYLTAQLNNLSLKGQNVSDAKARLALDTQAIQEKYIRALNSSRLFVNTNIFATDGSVMQSEYITLENLAASGYKVSDGSKILGYKWERVPTGETETIKAGFEKVAIYPTQNVVTTPAFSDPSPNAIGSIEKMQQLIESMGLTDKDLAVKSYTTTVNGKSQEINSIVIKSQEGFNKVYETLQNEAVNGVTDNALQQNYTFDMDTVDLSAYKSTGIPFFQGLFDGNGVTITGLKGSQGLFRDVYGVVKNVNIKDPIIESERDCLGGIAGYLGNGGLIENCNVSNLKLICDLTNQEYEEGYDSERAGVGGIVGYNGGSIRNSSVQGQISIPNADDSFGYIGGFIGANINTEYGDTNNVIENCYSDVNIKLGDTLNYSNSINAFIGDDTYEAIIKNCMSLGSITNSKGKAINGTDLANWGPVIESNLNNFIALDTRNNNDVLYWNSETNPAYDNGFSVIPSDLTKQTVTLADGTVTKLWIAAGKEGYDKESQASAILNKLPVLNLNELQAQGLSKDVVESTVDLTAKATYNWQQKLVTVPKYEDRLVPDPDFKINSLALEEGLRSGAYTLVKEADKSSTTTILLNGVYYDTVALTNCTVLTDEAEDKLIEKAEAEYNRDMQEIQMQDKRYEMDQKKIDTEFDALTKEEESIKTVLKNNTERSYKTFG